MVGVPDCHCLAALLEREESTQEREIPGFGRTNPVSHREQRA